MPRKLLIDRDKMTKTHNYTHACEVKTNQNVGNRWKPTECVGISQNQ